MKTYRLVVILALATLAGAAPTAVAEDKKSWTGESVMYTKPAKDIKFGDRLDDKQVYFPFTGILPIKVREDRDGRLRIHDGHNEGWADKDDFILANDAPAYFHRRVQADRKDTWALWMRGIGWQEKGEFDRAIKDYDECIRLDPASSAYFNSRGLAYFAKQDFDRAIKDYDEAVRLNPKDVFAFNSRGSAYYDKQDFDRAIRDFDRAIRLDATFVLAINNRGIVYYAKNDYDRAIKNYGEAIRLDPKFALAFNSRAAAHCAKKDYDRAIKDYDECVRLDPKDAYAPFSRSVAEMVTRRAGCVKGFQAVLDLQGYKGGLAVYAVILGHLAAGQAGDDAAAKRFLGDSAGKLDAAWPEPAVRFLRGDLDEPGLLKLATDDDKRTEARCFLGLHHALKGRPAEALAHYRWVKDHGTPTFIEYGIAVAELDRLDAPAKGAKP